MYPVWLNYVESFTYTPKGRKQRFRYWLVLTPTVYNNRNEWILYSNYTNQILQLKIVAILQDSDFFDRIGEKYTVRTNTRPSSPI